MISMNKFDTQGSPGATGYSSSIVLAVIASAFEITHFVFGLRGSALPWIVLGIFVPIVGVVSGIVGALKGHRLGVTGSLICAANLVIAIWTFAYRNLFVT